MIYNTLSSRQSHCESSPGSLDEYSAMWLPSQSTWTVSPLEKSPAIRIHHHHLLLLSRKAVTHLPSHKG